MGHKKDYANPYDIGYPRPGLVTGTKKWWGVKLTG